MKAMYCHSYGDPDVLRLQEIEKPIPKDNELLVRVVASSVTAADCMMRKGEPRFGRLFLGLFKPKYAITGTGFSGHIEAVGNNVSDWKIGQEICGESVFSTGSNAEYLCIPSSALFINKPNILSHAQASTLCDGVLTSYSFLNDLYSIKAGQSVLIVGSSGSLGSAAVQIAKDLGAQVTAVCSTENIQMAYQLGADDVIDYKKQDFKQLNKRYDLIYDSVVKHSFSKCTDSLSKHGQYLSPVLSLGLLFQMLWTKTFSTQKAHFSATGMRKPSDLKKLLLEISNLIKTEKIAVLIDREYPLNQLAEAHRYIETGRKKGNIVILMKE